ncbi:MAG: RICIN domain-containing protein [Bacteroidota bacterium]
MKNDWTPVHSRKLANRLMADCLAVLSILLWIIVAGSSSAWAQTGQQALAPGHVSYYPRVIRLQNDNLSPKRLIASFDQGNTGLIYESLDNGITWSANPVGSIKETAGPFNCCSGLYEVPQPMGSTVAGTLFWATSLGTDQANRTASSIRIYKSTDKGRNWSYFSTPVSGNTGLWEPEFIVDSLGRLVMYFSSEEYKSSGYNQLLAHRISTDGGLTWGTDVIDVGVNDGLKRPGMAVVRKLPDGTYFMTYEICGLGCDVYFRTSPNGYAWGDASQLGTRIVSTDSHHFAHAPNMAWANDGSLKGKLLVVGQTLLNTADNSFAAEKGRVIMVNANGGAGAWTEMAAPVESPNIGDNPCPNYSSPLLPSVDGTQVLEIALDFWNGRCQAYFQTGSISAPVKTIFSPVNIPSGFYRLLSKNSAKALAAVNCFSAGAIIQQEDFSGSSCQVWQLDALGDGYYHITSSNSGLAMEVKGCANNLGGTVQLGTSNTSDCQKWRLEESGGGYYRLVSKNSGLVLDVNACSRISGAKVQQWEWVGGDCQRWKLEPWEQIPLAVEEFITDRLLIHSSPDSNRLTVRGPFSALSDVKVVLTDILSRPLITKMQSISYDSTQLEIDSRHLDSGIYILQLQQGKRHWVQKVVIRK